MASISRRQFVGASLAAGAVISSGLANKHSLAASSEPSIAYGLVTYMWGADWDLPTLLEELQEDGRAWASSCGRRTPTRSSRN